MGGVIGERTTVYFPRDYEIAFTAYARESTGLAGKSRKRFREPGVYLGKFSPVVSEDKNAKSGISRR